MDARFLQIHTLTSYPAALLNRDDAGFAKKIPFGGAVRTRVSSQCLKRHWRDFTGECSLRELRQPYSVRSRYTFENLIVKELIEDGLAESLVRTVTTKVMELVLGKSKKAEKAEEKKADAKKKSGEDGEAPVLQTSQLTVLGRPEVDYLKDIVRKAVSGAADAKQAEALLAKLFDKEMKKNLQALKLAAGLDAALFGRMVTSDILARCDAAIHVAHAFTVHEQASEPDYFSAMDDLLRESKTSELGSAHINTTDLTSGLFYSYVVVDVPHLVSNLEGCRPEDAGDADRDLAAGVVKSLIHLMATVSPGAKLGSTAPYACASFAMVECGRSQPRTLANAFLKPVDLKSESDLLADTYRALAGFMRDEDTMYGIRFTKNLAGMGSLAPILEVLEMKKPSSLKELAEWAADNVRRG